MTGCVCAARAGDVLEPVPTQIKDGIILVTDPTACADFAGPPLERLAQPWPDATRVPDLKMRRNANTFRRAIQISNKARPRFHDARSSG